MGNSRGHQNAAIKGQLIWNAIEMLKTNQEGALITKSIIVTAYN